MVHVRSRHDAPLAFVSEATSARFIAALSGMQEPQVVSVVATSRQGDGDAKGGESASSVRFALPQSIDIAFSASSCAKLLLVLHLAARHLTMQPLSVAKNTAPYKACLAAAMDDVRQEQGGDGPAGQPQPRQRPRHRRRDDAAEIQWRADELYVPLLCVNYHHHHHHHATSPYCNMRSGVVRDGNGETLPNVLPTGDFMAEGQALSTTLRSLLHRRASTLRSSSADPLEGVDCVRVLFGGCRQTAVEETGGSFGGVGLNLMGLPLSIVVRLLDVSGLLSDGTAPVRPSDSIAPSFPPPRGGGARPPIGQRNASTRCLWQTLTLDALATHCLKQWQRREADDPAVPVGSSGFTSHTTVPLCSTAGGSGSSRDIADPLAYETAELIEALRRADAAPDAVQAEGLSQRHRLPRIGPMASPYANVLSASSFVLQGSSVGRRTLPNDAVGCGADGGGDVPYRTLKTYHPSLHQQALNILGLNYTPRDAETIAFSSVEDTQRRASDARMGLCGWTFVHRAAVFAEAMLHKLGAVGATPSESIEGGAEAVVEFANAVFVEGARHHDPLSSDVTVVVADRPSVPSVSSLPVDAVCKLMSIFAVPSLLVGGGEVAIGGDLNADAATTISAWASQIPIVRNERMARWAHADFVTLLLHPDVPSHLGRDPTGRSLATMLPSMRRTCGVVRSAAGLQSVLSPEHGPWQNDVRCDDARTATDPCTRDLRGVVLRRAHQQKLGVSLTTLLTARYAWELLRLQLPQRYDGAILDRIASASMWLQRPLMGAAAGGSGGGGAHAAAGDDGLTTLLLDAAHHVLAFASSRFSPRRAALSRALATSATIVADSAAASLTPDDDEAASTPPPLNRHDDDTIGVGVRDLLQTAAAAPAALAMHLRAHGAASADIDDVDSSDVAITGLFGTVPRLPTVPQHALDGIGLDDAPPTTLSHALCSNNIYRAAEGYEVESVVPLHAAGDAMRCALGPFDITNTTINYVPMQAMHHGVAADSAQRTLRFCKRLQSARAHHCRGQGGGGGGGTHRRRAPPHCVEGDGRHPNDEGCLPTDLAIQTLGSIHDVRLRLVQVAALTTAIHVPSKYATRYSVGVAAQEKSGPNQAPPSTSLAAMLPIAGPPAPDPGEAPSGRVAAVDNKRGVYNNSPRSGGRALAKCGDAQHTLEVVALLEFVTAELEALCSEATKAIDGCRQPAASSTTTRPAVAAYGDDLKRDLEARLKQRFTFEDAAFADEQRARQQQLLALHRAQCAVRDHALPALSKLYSVDEDALVAAVASLPIGTTTGGDAARQPMGGRHAGRNAAAGTDGGNSTESSVSAAIRHLSSSVSTARAQLDVLADLDAQQRDVQRQRDGTTKLKAEVLALRAEMLTTLEATKVSRQQRLNELSEAYQSRLNNRASAMRQRSRTEQRLIADQCAVLEEQLETATNPVLEVQRMRDVHARRVAKLEAEFASLQRMEEQVERERDMFSASLIGRWDSSGASPATGRHYSSRPTMGAPNASRAFQGSGAPEARRYLPICFVVGTAPPQPTPARGGGGGASNDDDNGSSTTRRHLSSTHVQILTPTEFATGFELLSAASTDETAQGVEGSCTPTTDTTTIGVGGGVDDASIAAHRTVCCAMWCDALAMFAPRTLKYDVTLRPAPCGPAGGGTAPSR